MKVIVNEKYQINTSEQGYDLVELVERTNKKTGEKTPSESFVGYYGGNLTALANKLIHLKIHENGAELSMKEFLIEYKKIRDDIQEQLKVLS